MILEKEIKKYDIKKCKSVIRKLKKENYEMEEEMSYIESGIYSNESSIDQLKERIKKLTPKK